MKLWEKNIPLNERIESFTIGKDPEYDLDLAPYDILGSIAHARMLADIQILSQEECKHLVDELQRLYVEAEKGHLTIDTGMEDIHSQVEFMLTERLGDLGKKLHTGRSRNDQVLLDLRLYFRDQIKFMTSHIQQLFQTLIELSDQHKDILLPGYTHLQAAMPSSAGLWLSAFAENLVDDLRIWKAAFDTINQNPLGSAAGYGTSLPINRTLTTELLGFADMDYNVIHAQMGRGRSELFLAFAIASTANNLAKLAMDVCLYNSQNFGFITLADAYTTGSSIMPHKKNPDVFELIRGKCNRLCQLPSTISASIGHLPSGYHRDFQLLKESILPALVELADCLDITNEAMQQISFKDHLLDDPKYKYIFSVEEVNKLVEMGIPFREAYQQVGKKMSDPDYVPLTDIKHTHEGSLGNLCLEQIAAKFASASSAFDFSYQDQLEALLQ